MLPNKSSEKQKHTEGDILGKYIVYAWSPS